MLTPVALFVFAVLVVMLGVAIPNTESLYYDLENELGDKEQNEELPAEIGTGDDAMESVDVNVTEDADDSGSHDSEVDAKKIAEELYGSSDLG